MSVQPIRVLIADDHPLFRKGMRALLATRPEFDVVGEATTGAEAVEQAAALRPDVVLMDLQMPDGNGVAATRDIARDSPRVRVLMVTLFEDDASVFAALRAGARGYVLKDADEDEMVRAILSVSTGEAIFSPSIATRVLAFFAAPQPTVQPRAFPMLTEREREILAMIAQGHSNLTIAGDFRRAARDQRAHSRAPRREHLDPARMPEACDTAWLQRTFRFHAGTTRAWPCPVPAPPPWSSVRAHVESPQCARVNPEMVPRKRVSC
jgi:DNA-binding NarL/FixJ family response regulator